MIVSQVLAFTAVAFRILPTTSTIPEKNVPSAVTAGAEPTLHHRLRNGAKKSNLTDLAQIHSSDGAGIQLGRGRYIVHFTTAKILQSVVNGPGFD
jgi:hypothetical protein